MMKEIDYKFNYCASAIDESCSDVAGFNLESAKACNEVVRRLLATDQAHSSILWWGTEAFTTPGMDPIAL